MGASHTKPGPAAVLAALALVGCSKEPDPLDSAPSDAEVPDAGSGPIPWPQFRGPHASGIAEGRPLPVTWDVESGRGIRWSVAIEGLGHSSPVIAGERIFLTSAIRIGDAPVHRKRLDDGFLLIDPAEHSFRIHCLDRDTGEVLWTDECHRGVPKTGIHPDNSYASSTPATDGRVVVAHFGSEGLYAYRVTGERLWSRSFGRLASVAFDAPDAEYGFASSPVLEDGSVVLQCDVFRGSFLARIDAGTGDDIWRVPRDDLPGWSTPTIAHDGERKIVLCNGHREIAAYDFETGERLWWTEGGGDIPVPTPVVAGGVAYFTSSHGRYSPVYAIRLDASGFVDPSEPNSRSMVWGSPQGGSYIPTPLVYDGLLFRVNNAGILKCVGALDGKMRFRSRLGDGTERFFASPVAGDGKLYAVSKDGRVFVAACGPKMRLLATNDMGEPCEATPAIADGVLFIRTASHLYAIDGAEE